MPQSRVYLFQGNCLVVPCSVKDDDAPCGIDRDAAVRDFGGLDYFTVPPVLSFEESAQLPLQCALLKNDLPLPSSWKTLLVRQLLPAISSAQGNRLTDHLLRCFHIVQWRNKSVFCGSCGEKNSDSPDELARLCPRCGRIEYPRISPAVIVLISDKKDRILLAHNNKFKNNMYSLIAGFAEAGESLEAAVCREIKEELDIDVAGIRYEKSQSWPFPDSLMIGFTAHYAGGEIKPDGKEIADARWFSRKTIEKSAEAEYCPGNNAGDDFFIPELPAHGSISRYLIEKWLKGFPV